MTNGSLKMPDGRNDLVWQLVDKLDETRRYPRVPLDIKVALRTDDGAKFSARIVNVSPDGLQVRCCVESACRMHPNGGKVDPENGPFVNVALRLPVAGGTRTLAARCRMLYLTTVDTEPRCVIGLRFVKLDLQSERMIDEFFSDQLVMDVGDCAVA